MGRETGRHGDAKMKSGVVTPEKEWAKTWHAARLDVELLHGSYLNQAFHRHSHEYYVICVIERGFQSFTHKGTKYFTPPGGLILINPDAVHTGEAADEQGFEMICIYPTVFHMQNALEEVTGSHHPAPYFSNVRVDNPWATQSIRTLHRAILSSADSLESETNFVWTMAELVMQFAELHPEPQKLGTEREAIRRVCRLIEERFAEGISLAELAQHASLSPYYLLRVFRTQVGMPPNAYLESVRIRHAQRLIEEGFPLAEVAAEVGFSSQSHLTRCFKKIIGVTPGQYAQRR